MKTINSNGVTKVVLTIDDRIPSEREMNQKYGPGKWAIEFEHASGSRNRLANPENPRRRLW